MKRILAIAAAMLVSSGVLANDGDSMHKGMDHSKMRKMRGEHQGHGSQVDAHFLDRFVKHHQDGIEMAKLAQARAQTPEIKSMAEKILKDQPKEIAQMQKWRTRHFNSVGKATDMPPEMQMARLRTASGSEFDLVFAGMMKKHHEDGIKMIEDVEGDLKNPEVKQFAEQAKKNQSKERDQLAQLQSSLKGTLSGTTSGQ